MNELNFYNTMNNIFGSNRVDGFMVDVLQVKNGYELMANLPGIKKEDVVIEFRKGNLIISVEKKEDVNDGKYILRERAHNKLERGFYFGEGIDSDSIKARMENGVLYMSLSIASKEAKKNITIE